MFVRKIPLELLLIAPYKTRGMYRNFIIDTITREAQSTMGNHILSDKLMTVLHGFPKSRNLTQRILNIVRSAVFDGIMEWVINEEFWGNFFFHFSRLNFKKK